MSFPRYPAYKDSGVDWLGEVPGHWGVVRLKFVATVQTGVAKGKDNSGKAVMEVPYLRVANVQDGYLDLSDLAIIEIPADDLDRYTLRPGDVLMNEGGDYDKLGRGHVWDGEVSPCIHQNHVFAVRPTGVSSGWLNRITGSNYAQFYFMSRSKQSTNLASISSTNIMELPVVLPSVPERDVIDAFLDRETAKIDALAAEYRILIELLKEKRQAVISHAVTKGLDPTVAMKDSGVEWLGEVPEHWVVFALSRIASERCDGPFGTAIKSEHYKDEGARVIRLQNIRAGRFDGTDEAFLDLDYFKQELSGHGVVAGDVLIAGLGDENNAVGRACVAPEDLGPALVKADCFRFRLDGKVAVPRFIASQLSVGASSDGGYYATGTTRQRIPLSATGRRRIALPPVSEQTDIARALDRETAKLDGLVTEAEQAISLLQERRTALISAAVTGKIDVRGLVEDPAT